MGLQVECLGCGRPVTVPGAAREAAPNPLALSDDVRAALVERLGVYLGPIAKHLLKTVAAQVDTVPQLCQKVAEFIPNQKDRDAFLQSNASDLATASALGAPARPPSSPMAPHGSSVSWPPGTLDELKTGLAHYLGPMAGHVVDQAAREARTMDHLHDVLAAKISSPNDRAQWRKSLAASRH